MIVMICLTVFLYICMAALMTSAVYFASNGRFFKRFYHDVIGFHIPDNDLGVDGHSDVTRCKVCKKHIY